MKICLIDKNKRERFIDISNSAVGDNPSFISVENCFVNDSEGNKTPIYIKRMRDHTAQTLCNYIFAKYKQD